MASSSTSRYIVYFAIGVVGYFDTLSQALGAKYHNALLTGTSLDKIVIKEITPLADEQTMSLAA